MDSQDSSRLRSHIGIVADYFHAHPDGAICYNRADSPDTDHAQCLLVEFRSHEVLFFPLPFPEGLVFLGCHLRIVLSDTGPGGPVSEVTPRTGRRVGLKNTLQRLQTLYEDAYVFDIEKRENTGLLITIHIPYRTAGSDG